MLCSERGKSSLGMPTRTRQTMERTWEEVRVLCITCALATDLSHCLAIACEVLARRVVHLAPPDKTVSMLSTRFRFKEIDEDISEKASALELAVDSHWSVHEFYPLPFYAHLHECSTIFLSSTEAQDGELRAGTCSAQH